MNQNEVHTIPWSELVHWEKLKRYEKVASSIVALQHCDELRWKNVLFSSFHRPSSAQASPIWYPPEVWLKPRLGARAGAPLPLCPSSPCACRVVLRIKEPLPGFSSQGFVEDFCSLRSSEGRLVVSSSRCLLSCLFSRLKNSKPNLFWSKFWSMILLWLSVQTVQILLNHQIINSSFIVHHVLCRSAMRFQS